MNTMIINLNDEDFECTEFYDIGLGGGINITEYPRKKHIGEWWGVSLPDDEEDEEEMNYFKIRLETFLMSINYY